MSKHEQKKLLEDERKTKGPKSRIWTKQVRKSLVFIRAFLTVKKHATVRTYNLKDYFGKFEDIITAVDASPWGLGGVLYKKGEAMALVCFPAVR